MTVIFADGHRQIRQYMRIPVKREDAAAPTPAGAVSDWIHEQREVGSVLQVSPPFGDFAIDTESNEPVVLLSAGAGITPMIAALNRIARHTPRRHAIMQAQRGAPTEAGVPAGRLHRAVFGPEALEHLLQAVA